MKRNGKLGLINIDKSGANKAAIIDYNTEHITRIRIRQCKYLNIAISKAPNPTKCCGAKFFEECTRKK